VTLAIDGADPAQPSVERLVAHTAAGILAANPHVRRVTVEGRDGRHLGEGSRAEHHEAHDVSIPEQLHEPRTTRDRAPSVVRPPSSAHPTRVDDGGDDPVPHRTLRQRFDLPVAVTSELGDDPDLIDVLAAIASAGGYEVQNHGDVVLADSTALVALRGPGADAMNHAFRIYDASGADAGIAVALGYLSPLEVERRELLAPDLRYVGPDAVQRMADAVALGADPLAFAVAPALH